MKKFGWFLLVASVLLISASVSEAAPKLVGSWNGTYTLICPGVADVEEGALTMVVEYQERNLFRGSATVNEVQDLVFTGAISGSRVGITFLDPDYEDEPSILFDTTVSESKLAGIFRSIGSGCSGLISVKKQ